MDAADWTTDVMQEAAQMKSLKCDLADKEPSVSDLGKFNPDNFNSFEDAFLNLLVQSYGVLHEPLHYVVCPATAPEAFATTKELGCTNFL